MRPILSILAGLIAVFYFVILPMRANMMVSIAKNVPMHAQSAYNIAAYASIFDKCNPVLLDFLGDQAFIIKNYFSAEMAYNQGIACAPKQANFWFKKSISLMNQSKSGIAEANQALSLEPNNIYIKGLLSRK